MNQDTKTKKKRIAVVGYGGTIVMMVRKNVVQPAENVEEILAMVPRIQDIADVTLHVLSNKDSTNVGPHDWTKLANFIAREHDNYDGFVITHGTNTMSYTATALALALGPNLKKPVVITGSQLPLVEYGDDAKFNLENAVKTAVTAAEEGFAEVMIAFNDVILRGCRSVKVSEADFRAFGSPAYPHIGRITARGVVFSQYARKVSEVTGEFKVQPHFETGILTIDLVPGQLPELIDPVLASGHCKGLILKSHGAGSVPDEGAFSFIDLIKRTVKEYNIPVVVATKFQGGNVCKTTNDAPAVEAIKAGAIQGGDMTDVATEIKLMWLLAQGHRDSEKLRELLLTDLVGEVTAA